MDCTCAPNFCYLNIKACEVNNHSQIFCSFNTYGFFLAVGIIVFLFKSISHTNNSTLEFIKIIFIPSLIGLSTNIIINILYNNSVLNLSTLHFTLGLFITWSLIKLKSNHILVYFLFGMAFAKYGCHISGDGHWGKILTTKDFTYELFKDCKYKHNVINQGTLLKNCAIKYNKILDQPRFPLPLLESFSILVLALIVYLFFLEIKYFKFIANLFIMFKSISNNLLLEKRDDSALIIFVLSLTLLVGWCLEYYYFRKPSKENIKQIK